MPEGYLFWIIYILFSWFDRTFFILKSYLPNRGNLVVNLESPPCFTSVIRIHNVLKFISLNQTYLQASIEEKGTPRCSTGCCCRCRSSHNYVSLSNCALRGNAWALYRYCNIYHQYLHVAAHFNRLNGFIAILSHAAKALKLKVVKVFVQHLDGRMFYERQVYLGDSSTLWRNVIKYLLSADYWLLWCNLS